jgi:hypothetical protein
LAGNTIESVSVPDGLVKERYQASTESLRAVTSHDLRGVCDVALVVKRVNINTIPARREHELEANTIKAISIKVSLIRKEVAIKRTLGRDGVIEAVETKSCLSEEGLLGHVASPVRLWEIRNGIAKVTLVGIAGDHLEVLGECREGGVVCIGVQKIVAGCTLALKCR